MTENNGWVEYKQRVLYQLDELQKLCNVINNKVDVIKEDVIVLKVKAAFYGAVASAFVAILAKLIFK